MTETEENVNLDEIEASIRRCEEFLAANEIDFAVRPAARIEEQHVERQQIMDIDFEHKQVALQQRQGDSQMALQNVKPSDAEIQEAILESRKLQKSAEKQQRKESAQETGSQLPGRRSENSGSGVDQKQLRKPSYQVSEEELERDSVPIRRSSDQRLEPSPPRMAENSANQGRSLQFNEQEGGGQDKLAMQKKQAPVDKSSAGGHYAGGRTAVVPSGASREGSEPEQQRNSAAGLEKSAALPPRESLSRLSDSYDTAVASQHAIASSRVSQKQLQNVQLINGKSPMVSTQRDEMIYEKKQPKYTKSFKTQEIIEKLKQEQEEKEMKECTFEPKLRTKGYKLTEEEAAEKLYQESSIIQQQRELMNCQKAHDIEEKCSFEPKINQKSEQIVKQKFSQERVEDRMLAEAEQTKERLTFRQQEKEYEESNIQSIMSEEYKRRRDLLAERQRQRKENEQLSKLEQIQLQQQFQAEMECTFEPRINEESEMITEKLPSNFLERQALFEQEREQKLQELKEQNEKNVTLTPKINSQYEGEQKGLGLAHERLYLDAETRRNLENSAVRSEDLLINDEDCTFSPKINEESKRLTKNKNYNIQEETVELYKETLQKQKDLELQKESEEQFSFEPELSKTAENAQSHYTFNDPRVLMAEILDEEETKEMTLRAKQEEEFLEKESAFLQEKPKIGKIDKTIYEPKEVKGLDTFMQKVMKSRNLLEEQKKREEKAFNSGKNWKNRQTIAEEFDISVTTKKPAEFKEVEAREKTTDQKMRDLVGAILRSEI